MQDTALLLSRVAKPDGTFHRRVSFFDSEEEDFYITVGVPKSSGIEFLDDKKVAEKVVKELAARGWRAIPHEGVGSALFRPEEAAVMNGTFNVERINN